MTSATPKTGSINVFARWRGPAQPDGGAGKIDRTTTSLDTNTLLSTTISQREIDNRNQSWTSPPAFKAIFSPEDDNRAVYDTVVAPAIPLVLLHGATCNFFAYGHSGSGKTHTMIGYDYNDDTQLGLCLHAARQLFEKLDKLNEDSEGKDERLGVGFSLFELRKKSAFDLLNGRTECHIREGPDGKVHVRGETEMFDGGKVRVQPIVKRPCWSYESLRDELTHAVGNRAVGSSSVHDQSSRTHAILELEIICQQLVHVRQAVVDRQSEVVPVGKRATDTAIEEQSRGYIALPGGGWGPNPDYTIDQERIDAAEAEKAEYEARVTSAEEAVDIILKSSTSPCLGARMVFVDLAGAEYHQEKGVQLQTHRQTPQERQEGRQINK